MFLNSLVPCSVSPRQRCHVDITGVSDDDIIDLMPARLFTFPDVINFEFVYFAVKYLSVTSCQIARPLRGGRESGPRPMPWPITHQACSLQHSPGRVAKTYIPVCDACSLDDVVRSSTNNLRTHCTHHNAEQSLVRGAPSSPSDFFCSRRGFRAPNDMHQIPGLELKLTTLDTASADSLGCGIS